MEAHIDRKLKSISELCHQRHSNFFRNLATDLPEWHDTFVANCGVAKYNSKKALDKMDPLQFAIEKTEKLIYSTKIHGRCSR